MAVILSGDFHGGGFGEAEVLKTKYLGIFCSLQGIKIPDIHYHIIPGDGGALWPNSKEADYWFEWLSMKPFITLVLPGNHEPYPVIYDDRRKVQCAAAGITGDSNTSLYKVYDNVFYFRRNCEYRIEGKKLLVLGGALSVDQDMREPYKSWWPEELLSPQEEQELLSSTKGKTYDAVLAHTAPFSRLPDIFENRNFNDSGYPVDPTTQIYDRLIESVGCCGEAKTLTTKKLDSFCLLHGIKLHDIHYHIILADGGALWPNNKESAYWFEWLSMKPFITLVLPGNHEPYPVIYDEQRKVTCDTAGITGDSKAALYKVYDNVFYSQRNSEYSIEGKKLLVLGGALSVDQDMREPYESWWPEELLSPQEEQELLSSTKGKTYDAVLAHTAPFSRLPDIFENRNFNDSGYPVDPTTQIYDRLIENIDCGDWYFGHFHRNKDTENNGIYYHCLYKRLMLLN